MWLLYVGLGLIAVIGFLFVFSYFQAKKSSVKMDAENFKQNMRKAQLIDVRNKNEYDAGHINGARNISISMLTREYAKLRKDQPIYLYCDSGKRSSRASVFLRSRGFINIIELKEGLKGWDGPLKEK
ncbi:MAG: hypothetical protein K0Q49_881 [Haloplasmataceae bacterium]|jgi:rhodanese-related sulfurtransferase|nr:hypothetical protein [Haloplasmataceae bacterium]